MLDLYRRHTKRCPHRGKGQGWTKCSCPIWCYGELNGKQIRESLKMRDWQRALRKLEQREAPDAKPEKTLSEAIADFEAANVDLAPATKRNYHRIMRFFADFSKGRGVSLVSAVPPEVIDGYRVGREIGLLTWTKELQALRHFFRFCEDREWIERNPAKRVAMPRNIKPTDKEPYSPNDVAKILAACDGRRHVYERLRTRAMVLLLRYTALRISDVALLAKDRIKDGWIYLRTKKNGNPVRLELQADLKFALEALPTPRGAADGCPYFFWSGNGTTRAAVRDVSRSLENVFEASGVPGAHAHRFRHTLATDILGIGGTFEEAADVLGNSPAIVRKHYAKWSIARQERISTLMRTLFVQKMYAPENAAVNPEESMDWNYDPTGRRTTCAIS